MSRLIFEGDTTKRFGEKFPRPFIEQIRAYDNGVEVDIAFYFKVPNEQEAVDAFVADLKNVEKFSQSIVLSAVKGTYLDALKNKNFKIVEDAMNWQGSASGSIITKIISFSDFMNGLETSPDTRRVSVSTSMLRSRADIFGSTEAEIEPERPRLMDSVITREMEAEIEPESASLTDPFSGFTPSVSDSRPSTAMTRELDPPSNRADSDNFPQRDTMTPQITMPFVSYNVGIKDDFYSLEGVRFMKAFGTLVIDYNSSGEMYITCFVRND
jgi:hypothetical protein